MNKQQLIDTTTITSHFLDAFHYETGVKLTIKDVNDDFELDNGESVNLVDVVPSLPLTENFYEKYTMLEDRLMNEYGICLNLLYDT